MKYIKHTILIFFILFFCSPVSALPNKTLILCISETSTEVLNAYFQLLQKAYNEIGYNTELKKLPSKKAVAHTNDGKVDGLVLTTKTILRSSKNIIAVEVPLTHIDLVAYSITKDFKVTGLTSCANHG